MATNKIRKHDVDLSASDVGAIPNPSGLLDTSVIVGGGVTYAGFIANASGDERQTVLQLITSPEDISNIVRVGVRSADGSSENYYRLYGEHNAFSTFLPLSGGTLNGQLLFKSGEAIYHIVPQSDGNFIIRSTSMGLCMNHANNLNNFLYLTDFNTGVGYKLFGEHNKPSGTYVGNGTADERWIVVGGIGRFLLIKTYGHGFAILTDVGGVMVAGGASLEPISASEARYQDGKLMLKTNKSVLNQNGVAIIYTVF